jgi:hypothetical protein
MYSYTIPTTNVVYQAESIVNSNLQQNANMRTNWAYRQYMQSNAINIMKYNTYEAIYSSGNNPYQLSNAVEADQNPFLYSSSYDNRNAKVSHPNTDLRQSYLEKEQFKSRMISPSIPTNSWKL